MGVSLFHLLMMSLAGMALGILYFGGLWWTVRRLPDTRRPSLWTLVSFFARTSLTLAGLYLASGGRWEKILVGLLGFMIARELFLRRLRPYLTNLTHEKGFHP